MRLNFSKEWLYLLPLTLSVTAGGRAAAEEAKKADAVEYPKTTWSGDFSFRDDNYTTGEAIEGDKSTAMNEDRQRIRLRLMFTRDVAEGVSLIARLNTRAGTGGNPTSSFDTLTDSGNPKNVSLDLAYAALKPYPGVKLHLGRMPMSMTRMGKSQLIFASEATPEGMFGSYTYAVDAFSAGLNVGVFQFQNRPPTNTSNNVTSMIRVPQLVLGFTEGPLSAKLTYAKYDFTNMKNQTVPASGGARSNSMITNAKGEQLYANDYKVTNSGFEVVYKTEELGNAKVTAFYDTVTNSEAKKKNKGTYYGVYADGGKDFGAWFAGFMMRNIDKDAVVAAMTKGGTGHKQNEYWVGHGVGVNQTIELNYETFRYELTGNPSTYRNDKEFLTTYTLTF